NAVETCDASGNSWSTTETCTTFCAVGQCALSGLTVTQNANYDAVLVISGDLVVSGNSTMSSSTGDLTIIADNIRVEAGSAIAVAPSGESQRGSSCSMSSYPYARPANYGQSGMYTAAYGGDADAAIEPGSIGGRQGYYGCQTGVTWTVPPTHGGGTLHLIAEQDVTIAGQLLAAGAEQPDGGPYRGCRRRRAVCDD